MTITIAGTALFFVAVMMGLLLEMRGSPGRPGWFAGTGEWSEVFPISQCARGPSSSRHSCVPGVERDQLSIAGARGEWLARTREEPGFSACGSDNRICAGGHSYVCGAVFQVERLGWSDWIILVAATASVIIYAEISRWVRMWLAPARS